MNKLLVSDIIKLETGIYHLSVSSKDVNIYVNGEVTIYLINEILEKVNIYLEDNSVLTMYSINILNEFNKEIVIKQNNNSKVFYRESIINNQDSNLIVNNYIEGNNNESNINIRNISNSKESKVITNVFVKENTINNIALENLKGINNGGFIHMEPNIVCNSNEVEANHLTTLGSLDKFELEYFMSKGIKEELAKKMLLDSFIYNNMDEYINKYFGGDKNA